MTERNIHTVDAFHRKWYQVPASAPNTINEIFYGKQLETRLILNLDGIVISSVKIDAKDGYIYYITTLSQYMIYRFRIDDGNPQLLVATKGSVNVLSFTYYEQGLFWIEKTFNSSYKIRKLPKDKRKPITVFATKKEVSGIAFRESRKGNYKDEFVNSLSTCIDKDGSQRHLTEGMICDGIADCYGAFDEFYCCNDSASDLICGLKNIKIYCDTVFEKYDIDIDFLNLKLQFSFLLSKLLAANFCRIEGDYLDRFGSEKQLLIEYYRQESYVYRQIVAGDVFKNVTLITSMELQSLAIESLKEKTFFNFQSLTNLSITGTSLQSIERSTFEGIKNLSTLQITNNRKLQVIDKYAFYGLVYLKLLNISHNALSNLNGDTLSFLKSLKTIDLRGNEFVYSNLYFKSNDLLTVIYSDSYIACCMKPPSVTEDNCKTPKDAITGCDNLINDGTLRIFIWVIGIMALLGNIAVIAYRVFGSKPKNKSFIIFVTNLTVSDGLMGVYMLIIAFSDIKYEGHYQFYEYVWKNGILCNLSGIMSFVSSEASVFFILFITIDRILAVKYPIAGPRITTRIAYMMALLAWVISLVAAVVPSQIYYKFYSYSGVCVALPITSENFDGQLYSVAVFLGFNFLTFILIACGQYFIFREIQLSSRRVRSTLTSRDRDAAKLLLMVVITDCFCWIPIGVIIIMSQAGFRVPDVMYAWVVVFVLPINSAINPFLYTLGPVIKTTIQKTKTRKQSGRPSTKEIELKVIKKTMKSTDGSGDYSCNDKIEAISPLVEERMKEPQSVNDFEELNVRVEIEDIQQEDRDGK